jgi:hypothetical protein
MLFLSPLFGSFIATVLMLIYAAIESSLKWGELIQLINVLPITFIIMTIISYTLCLSIGRVIVKRKDENFWTDGFFMLMSTVCGFTLGLVFSIIVYNMGSTLLKSGFVFSAFFLGSLFTSSFYIGLEKELKKENK